MITTLVGVTTSAAVSMHDATSPNPVGVQARINGKSFNFTYDGTKKTSSISVNSHQINSPLEENWSILDWLFSFLPDFVKQELRNRVPISQN